MSVTYHHDPSMDTPSPLSHDALASAAIALEAAARGMGPLARARLHAPLPIMGSKLSPSPELNGAGAGVLEVDYADGSTRTFDIGAQGEIEPRRYAYAFAGVIETDAAPGVSGVSMADEDWFDKVLEHVGRALPAGFPGEIVYCSTPAPIPLNTGNYDEQPAGFDKR